MLKRTGIILALAFALALGLAMRATPASAQDTAYFTYVSEWAVPRAQWAEFEKERDQGNATMESLVANGTIIAWGNDINLVHTEDGYTHEDWFTATSRANILKALDVLRPGATGGAFLTVTQHRDFFLHTLAHNGKTITGATGYLRVSVYQLKPDAGPAFQATVEKYFLPVFDKEIADGTVLMYNFDNEELHSDVPGTYFIAVLYASADALDKARAEMSAMEKANPAAGYEFNNLFIDESHRDGLSKVTSFQHK
jgi:hypothetical protein